MGAKRNIDLEAEEESFKSEIYTMLLAFNCKTSEALQLISDHEDTIHGWIDSRGRGTVVTAAVAARIILGTLK